MFEERTAKALNKLGVPSSRDVAALLARVDELSAKVAKLSKTAPAKKVSTRTARIDELAATAPAPRSAAAKRPPARKRAPARKPAA